MKTEVAMIRTVWGTEVRQMHKSELFAANDLVKAGNKWRVENGLTFFDLNDYFLQKGVQEFIAEVELRYGKSVIRTKGRNSITWVHPLLFIDIALAISPRLKIETYQWIIDDLCGIRDNSGDSFKEMCGYLYDHYPNKYEFPKFVKEVSAKIRRACNYSSEHENWNYASKEQLKMRDDLHKAIAGFADVLRKPEEAVRIALTQHQKRLRG